MIQIRQYLSGKKTKLIRHTNVWLFLCAVDTIYLLQYPVHIKLLILSLACDKTHLNTFIIVSLIV